MLYNNGREVLYLELSDPEFRGRNIRKDAMEAYCIRLEDNDDRTLSIAFDRARSKGPSSLVTTLLRSRRLARYR